MADRIRRLWRRQKWYGPYASRPPVTRQTSGLPRMSMNTHGLTVGSEARCEPERVVVSGDEHGALAFGERQQVVVTGVGRTSRLGSFSFSWCSCPRSWLSPCSSGPRGRMAKRTGLCRRGSAFVAAHGSDDRWKAIRSIRQSGSACSSRGHAPCPGRSLRASRPFSTRLLVALYRGGVQGPDEMPVELPVSPHNITGRRTFKLTQ